jgi:hypothetical protein
VRALWRLWAGGGYAGRRERGLSLDLAVGPRACDREVGPARLLANGEGADGAVERGGDGRDTRMATDLPPDLVARRPDVELGHVPVAAQCVSRLSAHPASVRVVSARAQSVSGPEGTCPAKKSSLRSFHGTSAGAGASVGARGPPTSHHGLAMTKGASTSLLLGLWSVTLIRPRIFVAPVHGGVHSLSVSTYALGTRSDPRMRAWVSRAPEASFFATGPTPSAVFIFCHMKRPENILPARHAIEKLASSSTRSAPLAAGADHGCCCSCSAFCSHSSTLNLLVIQLRGV